MIKSKLQHTFVLAAALAMSACGGGSSGPAPVAVVPPPPVATPPPPPVAETVTVTGFVTDMPIPNATVVITVNGQEFTAPNPTGADGSFEVEIQSDDPNALVRCDAVDPNGPVRFSALLNSFAGLQDSTDDDGVATDVNITNVTTAQLLLAEELSADGTIDDLAELLEVAEQIDPTELLELSAAIKVVVDSVDGVALPDGFDDVQDLAQAIVDGTSTFIADVELLNPGIIEDTIAEVVSDGFATVTFDADRVPGVYIDADGDDIVVLFEDGTGFFGEEDVFQDSQGVAYENQVVEAVSWSITDAGELEIVFTESQDVDTVVLVNEASNVLTLYVTSVEDDGAIVESDTFNVLHFGFDANGFDATAVAGSYNDPDDVDEATEFAVFLEDGTGYGLDVATGELDDYFNWEVNADGELLLTDDGEINGDDVELDDDREVIRLLEGSTADRLILLVFEYELDSDVLLEIDAFPVNYTSEIMTGPMPDVANTMLLEGKTYAFSDGDEKGLVTFGANGVFSEIFQDFDDQDGPEWEEGEGEWWVDDTGTLYITFVEADGTAETDEATVVSGLGEDRMVVLVSDDGVNDELALDRVVPFEAGEVVGSWAIVEGGQTTTETATFNADGTGAYFDDGVLDENFDWNVNSAGILVNTLDDGPIADVFSDNIHKLADSTADNLHVFSVFRRNGELENDTDDLTGPPEVIFEVNLTRVP